MLAPGQWGEYISVEKVSMLCCFSRVYSLISSHKIQMWLLVLDFSYTSVGMMLQDDEILLLVGTRNIPQVFSEEHHFIVQRANILFCVLVT